MKSFFYYLLAIGLLASCSKKSMQSIDLNSIDAIKKITFNKDIKPLLVSQCSPCHTTGGDRNNKWDNYSTTRNLITGIMGRVIKQPNDILFMPKNGTKLTDAQIVLLREWISTGLLEK